MRTPLIEFFDSIRDESALNQLITDGVAEDIHLEFKTKQNSSKPDLEEGDARHLSKALSGFANSDGGILIWGIATGRHEEARTLKPISGVRDFEARLKKSLLNSTQPVVDGVIITPIVSTKDPEAGFVKVLVPRSDAGPHRAMRADREYYKRTTEGFYKLEHFDLEDMFGRRPRPILRDCQEIIDSLD